MSKDSVISRHELFFATATVAAHFNASAESRDSGFRMRDLKFLVELFSNWVETGFPEYVLDVQNTQISRYLATLVAEGYARKISRRGPPSFRLTRTGLLELLSRVVSRSYRSERDSFFFLYYFIKNYKPRIEALVKQEGREFPPALRIELTSLVDERALLSRELVEARKELSKLELRLADASSTSELAIQGKAQNRSLGEIVEEAQRKFPYELNSQKPLSELISSIPEHHRLWELETGNRMRVAEMWNPAKAMLQSYILELEKLSTTNAG